MTSTLQIVDPADTSVTLFDFNHEAGTSNPYSLKTLLLGDMNLAPPAAEIDYFAPTATPGGLAVRKRDGLTESTFRIRAWASDPDDLVAGLGELSRLLDQGGVIKWVPHGSSETRYIDFEDSPSVALLRGQELSLYNAFGQIDAVDGIPIVIRRQPYLRGAELTSSTNKLVNSTLILDTDGAARPDLWAYDSAANISAESITNEYYQFTYGASASSAELRQTYDTAAAAQVWTFSAYGQVVSGPGNWKLRIRFLDSGGGALGSDTDSSAQTGTSMTRASVSATAPASTAKIRVAIVPTGTAGGATVFRMRRAQAEIAASASSYVVGAETVNGDPAASATHGLVYPIFIQGDAPSPVRLNAKVNAGADVQQVSMSALPSGGRAGDRDLTEYLNSVRLWQLEGGTLYTVGANVTSVRTNADASPQTGNTCIGLAPSAAGADVETTNHRRVRVTKTTNLDALRGTWDVWCRVKIAMVGKVHFQMRYAASSADPVPGAGPEVLHDTSVGGSQLASFGWVMLNLGRITIPEKRTLSQVTLELWARGDASVATAANNVFADYFLLTPAGESGSLGPSAQVSSVSAPYTARDTILGKDLTKTGATVDGNSAVIDANGEIAYQDRTGMAAGRYRATWRYSLRDGVSGDDFQFEAERTTGGAITVTAKLNDETTDVTNRTISVEFDNAATTNVWRIRAEQAAAGTGVLTVHEVVIEFVGVATTNESIATDPRPESIGAWRLDSSLNAKSEWATAGPTPMWLYPGLNLVSLWALSPRLGGLYSELENQIDASMTFSYTYEPRYRT